MVQVARTSRPKPRMRAKRRPAARDQRPPVLPSDRLQGWMVALFTVSLVLTLSAVVFEVAQLSRHHHFEVQSK